MAEVGFLGGGRGVSGLCKIASGRVSISIWSWGVGSVRGHALLAACEQGFGWHRTFSLAWSCRRGGIGGLWLPFLPQKGGHCKERI